LKFLILFLITAVTLSLGYAALVRLVDPRGEFGTGVFPVVDLDIRVRKMQLFRDYLATAAPEGLVVGSSRAMKLNPRTLEAATGHRFFNFAVDNARAEDYLAIYRWVHQQHVQIKLLVIGLDVEALHNDDRPEASLLRNNALVGALGSSKLPEPGLLAPFRAYQVVRLVKEYKQTFTIEYLTETVQAVRFFVRPQSRPLPLMEFEPNGYLRYSRWEQERAAGRFRFDHDLERCVTKSLGRFDNMTQLSLRRRGYLRQVVDEARADGARVVIWITSVHPLTSRYLEAHSKYPALLDATRAYEQALSREDGIAIYDFSRPENYDGTAMGWYDCLHIDETNADRVAFILSNELR
jgi:hypothetical protein